MQGRRRWSDDRRQRTQRVRGPLRAGEAGSARRRQPQHRASCPPPPVCRSRHWLSHHRRRRRGTDRLCQQHGLPHPRSRPPGNRRGGDRPDGTRHGVHDGHRGRDPLRRTPMFQERRFRPAQVRQLRNRSGHGHPQGVKGIHGPPQDRQSGGRLPRLLRLCRGQPDRRTRQLGWCRCTRERAGRPWHPPWCARRCRGPSLQ